MHSDITGQNRVEISLTSADLSRAPVFPFLVCTACTNIDSFDFLSDTSVTLHLPEPAQINANGGLKKLLQDVTATYRDEWKEIGLKFVGGQPERFKMTSASLDWITGVSTTRHQHERAEGFERNDRWRQCAQTEIGIMVRQMIWWRLAQKKTEE